MDIYNPNKIVDAENWLALDEAIRIELVHDFHSKLDLELTEDALRLHSSIHVIVENQLAMGVDLIPETFAKLTKYNKATHSSVKKLSVG
jgi:hypothetical protein